MKPPSSRNGAVNVDAATLHFVVEGCGLPALVIGSAVYYPRTFSQQLRDVFCLAFVDVRHFAAIEASCNFGNISLTTYTDDIERVRSEVGFERVVIVGHSHHGNLALEYAKRYPARVSHVVLIGSPPYDVQRTREAGNEYWAGQASEARKTALRDNWAKLSPEVLEAMPAPEAFIAQYIADAPKYWYDPCYNAAWLWEGVPVQMEVIQVFRDFFADYELAWHPERLSAPLLVVMGRHDYIVPPTLWDEARALRNVTFHLFEQSGHTPQLEEPKLFDQVLLAWVQTHSAA